MTVSYTHLFMNDKWAVNLLSTSQRNRKEKDYGCNKKLFQHFNCSRHDPLDAVV